MNEREDPPLDFGVRPFIAAAAAPLAATPLAFYTASIDTMAPPGHFAETMLGRAGRIALSSYLLASASGVVAFLLIYLFRLPSRVLIVVLTFGAPFALAFGLVAGPLADRGRAMA